MNSILIVDEQWRIVAYLDGFDLSPHPSLKGREPVPQGFGFSPLGETGEGFVVRVDIVPKRSEWDAEHS
jgi:hypothetical protein